MDAAAASRPVDPPPRAPWKGDATLIGLVGVAHSISHFSQLLLAPLFPWLKDAFGVGYAELGFLLTIFFVVFHLGKARHHEVPCRIRAQG
jgi:hypothetical protein